MKSILLTKGQFTIVNDADFDWLNQWDWSAQLGRGGKFYAMRRGPLPERKRIYLHRLICGASANKQVDHKNRNSLDNRRRNLRQCSTAQNGCNRGANKNNTSGFKGVSWYKRTAKWRAFIGVFSRLIHLGYFPTAAKAGRAYKAAARKYHGEFARI